jgi:hypothetical protein
MNLNDLITKMETLANSQEGMGEFIFENLSGIDSGAGNTYPVLFVQPPDSNIANINTPVELFNIEMWVLDLYHDTEKKSTTLSKKWSDTHDLGLQYLRELFNVETVNGVGIVSPVAVLRGQMLHNDTLIGTKYTFQIKLTTDCNTGTFV